MSIFQNFALTKKLVKIQYWLSLFWKLEMLMVYICIYGFLPDIKSLFGATKYYKFKMCAINHITCRVYWNLAIATLGDTSIHVFHNFMGNRLLYYPKKRLIILVYWSIYTYNAFLTISDGLKALGICFPFSFKIRADNVWCLNRLPNCKINLVSLYSELQGYTLPLLLTEIIGDVKQTHIKPSQITRFSYRFNEY